MERGKKEEKFGTGKKNSKGSENDSETERKKQRQMMDDCLESQVQ